MLTVKLAIKVITYVMYRTYLSFHSTMASWRRLDPDFCVMDSACNMLGHTKTLG